MLPRCDVYGPEYVFADIVIVVRCSGVDGWRSVAVIMQVQAGAFRR